MLMVVNLKRGRSAFGLQPVWRGLSATPASSGLWQGCTIWLVCVPVAADLLTSWLDTDWGPAVLFGGKFASYDLKPLKGSTTSQCLQDVATGRQPTFKHCSSRVVHLLRPACTPGKQSCIRKPLTMDSHRLDNRQVYFIQLVSRAQHMMGKSKEMAKARFRYF